MCGWCFTRKPLAGPCMTSHCLQPPSKLGKSCLICSDNGKLPVPNHIAHNPRSSKPVPLIIAHQSFQIPICTLIIAHQSFQVSICTLIIAHQYLSAFVHKALVLLSQLKGSFKGVSNNHLPCDILLMLLH